MRSEDDRGHVVIDVILYSCRATQLRKDVWWKVSIDL
jgi:hypothetical protein